MSSNKIRVRSDIENGVAQIKLLIEHPMETGLRTDPANGDLVPAHFIDEIVCEHAGKVVMEARCSEMIARNPYFAFRFIGARPGDALRIRWHDNLGATGEHDFTL